MIRAYFLPPPAKQKFLLLIPSMRSFFTALIKVKLSIIIVNSMNTQQLELYNDMIPMMETKFKKFIMVSMDTCANTKQQHIIIGHQIRSKCTFHKIKFNKTKKSFLNWLTKEKVFVELDALGVSQTI